MRRSDPTTVLDPITGLKRCYTCRELRPAIEFWKDTLTTDGLKYKCRICAAKELGSIPKHKHGVHNPKRCVACKIVKPAEDFPIRKSNGYPSLYSHCREYAYYKQRDYGKEYRTRLGPAYLARRVHSARMYMYGITKEQFEDMCGLQEGRCGICGAIANPPCVDHVHSTEEIRGILCTLCNTAIGYFKDSEKNIRNALIYLDTVRDRQCALDWLTVQRLKRSVQDICSRSKTG